MHLVAEQSSSSSLKSDSAKLVIKMISSMSRSMILLVLALLLVISLNPNEEKQVLALNNWFSVIVDTFSRCKSDLKPAYGVINHCLTEDLPGDDNFERNIAQVESYLGKKKPSIAYKKKVSSSRLRDAIELFTELSKVDHSSHRCSFEMTQTLMQNNAAADEAIERLMKTEKLFHFGSVADIRRIDRLIFEAANRRAQVCQPIYKKQFIHHSREYPETDFMRLREYFDKLLEHKLRQNPVPYLSVDDNIHIDDLINKKPIRIKTFIDKTKVGKLKRADINFVLDYLDRVATRNNDERVIKLKKLTARPDSKSAQNERKSINVALFRDYLVEPCKDYINLFGSVFESAIFDYKIKARLTLSKWDEDDYKYQKYLIYFGLCRRFVSDEQKLVKKFIAIM